MKKKMTAFLASALLLQAVPAWAALNMEYYTYGGYSAVVTAFQKIALIFSDAGYQALFFVVIVAAIFLGVMSTWFGAMRGAKVSPLGWAPPILLGVGLYLAFVVPKGNLTIYDPLMNRFQTVGNIPDGLVMVAGSLNLIERGLVDIIDTSGNVEGFTRTGGGLGFNMLYQATKGGFGLGNSYIGQSMRRYVKDCVLFEIQRPGTTLTTEQIKKNSQDFLSDLAAANSPSIYTVYYSTAKPEGESMSCQAAYSAINTFLGTASNLQDVVTQTCSSIGFNVTNPNELTRCRSNLSDFVGYLYNGAISVGPEAFMRQIGMMEALDDVLKEDNPDLALQAMSNRGIMTSGMSMGLVANEWLPVMRAVFTAVAIGLVPFLCLFLPTGIVGKATGLIAGFFIWLTCWGITDAIMHGIALDYSVQAMEYIRAHNLGYNAIMMFPSYTEKALAMFGFIRTAGIMLATVMTGMLVSFGGHALSMMASNVQGTLQGQAGQAGMASADPIGHMQARQQLMNTAIQQGSVNAWDNMGKQRFQEAAALGSTEMNKRVGGAEGFRSNADAAGMGERAFAKGSAMAQVSYVDGAGARHSGFNADGKMIETSARGVGTEKAVAGGMVQSTVEGKTHKAMGGEAYSSTDGQSQGAKFKNVKFTASDGQQYAMQKKWEESFANQIGTSISLEHFFQSTAKSGIAKDAAVNWLAENKSFDKSKDLNINDVKEKANQVYESFDTSMILTGGGNASLGAMDKGTGATVSGSLQGSAKKTGGEIDTDTERSTTATGQKFSAKGGAGINEGGSVRVYSDNSSTSADMSKIARTMGNTETKSLVESWQESRTRGTSHEMGLDDKVLANVMADSRFRAMQGDRDADAQKISALNYVNANSDSKIVQDAYNKAKTDYHGQTGFAKTVDTKLNDGKLMLQEKQQDLDEKFGNKFKGQNWIDDGVGGTPGAGKVRGTGGSSMLDRAKAEAAKEASYRDALNKVERGSKSVGNAVTSNSDQPHIKNDIKGPIIVNR